MVIPKISDERLAELVAKIKPVKTMGKIMPITKGFKPGKLYWLDVPEGICSRSQSYIWSATEGEEATGLQKMEFDEYTVLIKWGYYGFFKPSFAEIFSQTPEELVNVMVAFEIHGPEVRSDMFDGGWAQKLLNEGFQLATITPYERKK